MICYNLTICFTFYCRKIMCRDTWKTRGLNQKLADLDQSQAHVALKAHANTISKEPWLQSLVFLTASAIIALCLSANLLHQILSAAVVLILTFTFSQNSLKSSLSTFSSSSTRNVLGYSKMLS